MCTASVLARSVRSAEALARSAQLRIVRSTQRQLHEHERFGRIQLSTRWYRIAWLTLFLVRLCLLAFLAFLAFGYYFMTTPVFENPRSAYKLPSPTVLFTFSVILGTGAAVYTYQVVQMVRASVASGRLVFRARPAVSMRHNDREDAASASMVRQAWHRARALYAQVFGRRGLMGIEHPHFYQLLVAREAIEIALQGYQTYLSTTLVPRRWISDLATVLLVFNCWSPLLVHAFGPKSLASQRVLCLAVDMALDIGWSIVVPLCIIVPYLLTYERRYGAFPDRYLADNSWMLGWEMAMWQFCFTSWLDFVSSMFPCVGILASSRTIAALIDEQRSAVAPAHSHGHQDTTKLISGDGAHEIAPALYVVPTSSRAHPVAVAPVSSVQKLPKSRRSHARTTATRWTKAAMSGISVHFVAFFSLGCLIIGVHVDAIVTAGRLHSDVDASCLVRLRPWFSREYACAYANINCYAAYTSSRNSSSDTVEDDEAVIQTHLLAFESSALQYLVVSHAANLTLPSALARFSNLRMLEIYNSTLVAWPLSTAITSASHPNLWKLSLVRSNVSALPDALVTQPAPFVAVNLVATNLTTLPIAIHSTWRALKYLHIEQSDLRVVPPAIAAIETLNRLSLCHNALESLATPVPLASALSVLSVAQNPLQALPDVTLADASRLRTLSFEHTHIASAPSWVTDASDLDVFAFASLLCTGSAALDRNVHCATSAPQDACYYQLALVDANLGTH